MKAVNSKNHLVITGLVAVNLVFFAGNKSASAAGAKTKTKTVTESSGVSSTGPMEKRKSRRVESSSSETARAQQSFEVHALYTPLSDFVLQYGLGVNYYYSPSWQFGFNALMGNEDIAGHFDNKNTVELKEAKLSGLAAFAYARYFVGNSFNLSTGLGYRSGTFKYRIEDRVSTNFIEGDITITSIILTAGLGNHWTWSNGFTIGVDWVLAMVPLSGSAKATTEGTLGNKDIEELNDTMKDHGDDLSKVTSLTLALVAIGYAF